MTIAMRYLFFTGFWLFAGLATAIAQQDLLKKLQEESSPLEERTAGTFKGTRLINGHTVEVRQSGVLDFLISHRFGRLNSGAYSFFGLDESNIRLGFDYAVSDRLTLGLGRNSHLKVYDGILKYKIFWQESGKRAFPVSLVYLTNLAVQTFKRPELPMNFERRLAFNHQVLIARKFTDGLSLQLSPTFIHRNLVATRAEDNNGYAMGVGGRLKLTPRTSLNVEYYYRWGDPLDNTYNPLGIGVDIETGGHVFQLHLTNAQAMTETGFVPYTTGDFFGGDIHFGFNISRNFQLREGKKAVGW